MKRGVQDYLVKDNINAGSLRRTLTQAVAQAELRQRLDGSLRDLTAANLALEKEAATRKAAEAEMRAAKEAAEQANQAKTRFVAMVTHELRTPLNGILGYAQLLRLEGDLSARQDTQVGAMMQAGRHLLEMIEGVLDFASIEAGRMELRPEQIAVRDLAEACIVFISPMATERALSLRMVYAHDAPRHIVADPARLRQVLLNLLGNAVKYTREGSVELRVLAGGLPGAPAHRGRRYRSRDRRSLPPPAVPGFRAVGAQQVRSKAPAWAWRSPRGSCKPMGGAINYADPGLRRLSRANPNGGSVFWFELPASDRCRRQCTRTP